MMSRMHVAAMRAPASPRPAGMFPAAAAGPSPHAACADGHRQQAADQHVDQHADQCVDLTRRERDILPYLVSGKSNKYISIELSISSRTAEAHRANILRKMGVRSTMELACRVCPHRRAGE